MPSRLTAAQTELDGILARIARVTVTVTPDGAALQVDGTAVSSLAKMPLILPPGEHKLLATAAQPGEASPVVDLARERERRGGR